MNFKIGQKVESKSGNISVIRKIGRVAKSWKVAHPGNWVWLYFEGQSGGFCSDNYKCVK